MVQWERFFLHAKILACKMAFCPFPPTLHSFTLLFSILLVSVVLPKVNITNLKYIAFFCLYIYIERQYRW